jgi:hypothetical protein
MFVGIIIFLIGISIRAIIALFYRDSTHQRQAIIFFAAISPAALFLWQFTAAAALSKVARHLRLLLTCSLCLPFHIATKGNGSEGRQKTGII